MYFHAPDDQQSQLGQRSCIFPGLYIHTLDRWDIFDRSKTYMWNLRASPTPQKKVTWFWRLITFHHYYSECTLMVKSEISYRWENLYKTALYN